MATKKITLNELRSIVKQIINEERFTSMKGKWEELLNNNQINTFINKFQKYRDTALSKVEMEVKPAFSDVWVKFVDKDVPSSSGVNKFFDPHVSGPSDNYESGEIMFQYNDTTCIFNGELQGNSIDYKYSKTIQTKHNQPRTQEARQVAITFEDMCKSFIFKLRKDEVPTMFYKK